LSLFANTLSRCCCFFASSLRLLRLLRSLLPLFSVHRGGSVFLHCGVFLNPYQGGVNQLFSALSPGRDTGAGAGAEWRHSGRTPLLTCLTFFGTKFSFFTSLHKLNRSRNKRLHHLIEKLLQIIFKFWQKNEEFNFRITMKQGKWKLTRILRTFFDNCGWDIFNRYNTIKEFYCWRSD
jgi:hypothetical protein